MTETSENDVIKNGIKLIGEAVVTPGASLLLEGQVLEGGLHIIAGLLARSLLGPIGLLAVAANSYSRAATGKNLLQQAGIGTGSSPAHSTS